MKFKLGQVVVTRAVNDRVDRDLGFAEFVITSLHRHAVCDWGDLCDEDIEVNRQALIRHKGYLSGRLFSHYKSKTGLTKIYIITEIDESVTTILFPEDY